MQSVLSVHSDATTDILSAPDSSGQFRRDIHRLTADNSAGWFQLAGAFLLAAEHILAVPSSPQAPDGSESWLIAAPLLHIASDLSWFASYQSGRSRTACLAIASGNSSVCFQEASFFFASVK